jgi:TraM protein, DNA-binding
MPGLQTFVSSGTEKEIINIITTKKAEGANADEANISGITAMLVGPGLRVIQTATD